MEKLITYAGISIPLGKTNYVFRTATGQKRVDQLTKLGDLKVDLLPLPRAMTKVEAAQYFLDKEIYADLEYVVALLQKIVKKQ